MSNANRSLRYYFERLRSSEPIDFEHSRRIVLASAMLHGRRVAGTSLRVGLALLWKEYSDAMLFPLISAGLSMLALVSSSQSLAVDKQITISSSLHSSISEQYETARICGTAAATQSHHTVCTAKNVVTHSGKDIATNNEAVNPIPSVAPRLVDVQDMHCGMPPSITIPFGIQPFLPAPFLGVGVRMIATTLTANGRPITSNSSFAQNAAIDLSYRLNEQESFGIEIGQEFLSRDRNEDYDMLTGSPATGQVFRVRVDRLSNVNSLLAWYGGFYRFTATKLSILPSLNPFGQIVLGYTANGPLTKAIAGVEYRPGEQYIVQAATELTYLNYGLDGSRRSSFKAALSLGIAARW